MSIQSRLAQRYAKAFLHVFGQALNEEDFFNMMDAISFVEKKIDLLFALSLYETDKKTLDTLIKKFLFMTKLPASFQELIVILTEKKRLPLFREILKFIVWEYQLYKDQLYFALSTCPEVTKKDLTRIKKFFDKLTGSANIYTHSVDSALIAGIKAQNMYYMWEDSLQRRLRKIKAIVELGV